MMDRIKKGVHLRPVNQTARPKTKVGSDSMLFLPLDISFLNGKI
jgi:hypothetical protein